MRNFDTYGQFETPQLVLQNPNGQELDVISHAMNIRITHRYACYSDLEFDIPKTVNGVNVRYYDLVQQLREIKVDGYGVFVIDLPREESDGVITKKHVTAKTIDSLFSTKNLISFEGTYKLYDAMAGDSILKRFTDTFTQWKIEHVDSELWERYRTYNISEQNWYDFLMNSVQEDFDCVVTYDTINKTISVKTPKNAIKKTDIFVSFENLLKRVELSPDTTGIKTSLEVYGADGLSIHNVNPLGTSTIYNLSHFKTLDWFSGQDAIDAISKWENLIKELQPQYADFLTMLKTKNGEVIKLNSEMVDLNSEMKALEDVLSVQVSGNQNTNETCNKIDECERKIKTKQSEIDAKKSDIENVSNQIKGINDRLSFSKNFSQQQLKELDSIISRTSGTYTNETFVKTSTMTDIDIQDESQELYDLSLTVLEKECQPRYTFSGDIVNFLALKEFEVFGKQLELGAEITITIDGENMFNPVLLEYQIDFSNIVNSSVVFSNNIRLSNDLFTFSDIFGGITNTITSNSTNKGVWEDYIKSGDKDSVNSLKNDALDLATKDIVSSTGQSPTIDHTGIRGRKLLENGEYSPKQFWLTNNSFCMTDNNWSTSRLAIGEITFNGVKRYGIATEVIVGDLLAGQSLVIKNENNTVTIDGNGLTTTNASITLKRSDGSNEITLNPTDGIKIKSKINSAMVDVFYVDQSGNLNFKGNLTGATGTFSGDIRGSSFIGGSIDIGNGRFKVDSGGNCTARSVKITGGTFESSTLKGSTIEGTYIEGGNIKGSRIEGASIYGGSINITSNARLGGMLYLGSDTVDAGIVFGNSGAKIESNYGGFHFYGDGHSCDGDFVSTGDLYMGKMMEKVATQKWVLANAGGGAVWG